MAVCPSVPVDVSRSLLRGVSVVVCVSFVCLFVSVLLPGDCVSVWVCLFISVSGSLVPSPRASGGRAPLPELSPVRARGRVPAVGCWAPTEAREPAGRGDVPSPRPSPRPRSLCRPLPPRRDRGGLCRWRSAASRHLLPLGRCLLRGPDRSLARSASLGPRQRRPGRGLGCVRLGSAGLGQARRAAKTAKNPASYETGSRRCVRGGAIPTPLPSFNWLASPSSRAIGRTLGCGLDRPLCRRRGGGGGWSGRRSEGGILS